ncbi:TonB-dependent receptor [Sphingomonas carotinifaciens]|uniref:Outer membrane cobalamin receptor protein n=1 Tax=Sphingomonas carotinifaciens TaxID=1166323 RepID=A0A1G7M263_9SPHN|nr:TonB-dependent receptor [Sphingomonas carotinifaciens]MBB4086965.1 outer membrane receptor protein involved in Fe transport [Sphingomonas carotinifaciens]MWC42159.1 TonB-dependent receptor plug domain-containing protein [Sphingomonas carotinifaciens]SDF55270.1 Outer membrane cobalamin receptor protein [Sphingomonas carotinifaciens]
MNAVLRAKTFARSQCLSTSVAVLSAVLASAASAQNVSPEQGLDVASGLHGRDLSQYAQADTTGQITGYVTIETMAGELSGTTINLEGTRFSATTDGAGRFQLSGVPAGDYILVAKHAAMREQRRAITLSAAKPLVIDISLAPISGAEADVVTVTGTRIGAVRSSSSPVSVITAADIERKQVTNMTDLLRGEIPGLFVINPGVNDWTTQVFSRGSTSWNYGFSDLNNDYAKIFIDGVELSRPTLLSMIDPRTIERIETVRGPQAGTIYGTDGSNGLMKIVTKKGATGRPQLIAQASVGIMESRYKPDSATPIVQDHSLQLLGGDDDFGYRLGGVYQSTGEWARRYNSESYGLSGGLRARRGDFTLSLSAFHNHRELALSTYPNDPVPGQGSDYPMTQTLLAFSLGYQATPNWQHTLTIGQDRNSFGYDGVFLGRNNKQHTDYSRRTLRYFTSYNATINSDLSAVLTAGGDATFYDANGFEALGYPIVNGRPDYANARDYHPVEENWRNFGYYAMAELGFRKQLYLTLAARIEEGLRYVVPSEKRQVQPRVGLSYVLDRGPATVKLRSQWGRSVRAPITDVRAASVSSGISYRANPNLGPEVKEGWDAGADFTWRGIGTFSVTYFDEEGRDLIMPLSVDETARPRIREYQNYGIITNKGWEFEGNATLGPVLLRGNFTLIDNRIRKISPLVGTGQNAPGSRRISVPDYTGGITTTLRVLSGTVSANAFVLGPRILQFAGEAPALWRLNLRAEQQVSPGLLLFGRIDNVLHDQTSERFDFSIAPGRTTVIGVRCTF